MAALLFAVLPCAVLQLTACHKAPARIAVLPRTTGTMLWEPMHMGADEAARQAGLNLYWNGPSFEGDTDKQLSLFDAEVAKGDQGLILAPIETQTARTAVLATVTRKIPVVVVDDELGPPPGPYLSYVTNDEAMGVDLAAQRIAHLLPHGGSIAIMGIHSRLESGVSREEAFEKALAMRAPTVRIAMRRFGDPIVTHQQQIAAQLLHGPEPINALVALTAAATRGAFYARLASDPKSSTPILGFDQDQLLPIQSGDVDAVIVQDTYQIGRIAMRNIADVLAHRPVVGLTLVPPLLLSRENLTPATVARLSAYASYNWSRP